VKPEIAERLVQRTARIFQVSYDITSKHDRSRQSHERIEGGARERANLSIIFERKRERERSGKRDHRTNHSG
jgi:hypothetical protein